MLISCWNHCGTFAMVSGEEEHKAVGGALDVWAAAKRCCVGGTKAREPSGARKRSGRRERRPLDTKVMVAATRLMGDG